MNIVDLRINLIHFILICIDFVLVGVSELFVFRASGQGKIQVVKITEVDLIAHLHCAGGNRKGLINLVVAGVWDLLESSVFCIIPRFEKAAEVPPIDVPSGKEFVHFVLYLLLELLLELLIVHLNKLFEGQHALEVEVEEFAECLPVFLIAD